MESIFSWQNLQTFLRRKNFRPESRPPGPGRLSPVRGRGASVRTLSAGLCSVVVAAACCCWTSRSAIAYFSYSFPEYWVLLNRCRRALCTGAFRGCGWCGSTFHSRGADGLDLGQPLLVFIHSHRQKFDDRFAHAQAALDLVDHLAASFQREQHV